MAVAASSSLPQELLPALGQITSMLLRKLNGSAGLVAGAASGKVAGAAHVAASIDGVAAAAKKDDSTTTDAALWDSDPFSADSADSLDSTTTSSSSPVSLGSSVFSECVQLLQKQPDLISPTPLFLNSDANTDSRPLPSPFPRSLERQYAHWRRLPVLTLATFEENQRHFASEECEATAASRFGGILGRRKDGGRAAAEDFVRRSLGIYATRLFLDPSGLDGFMTSQTVLLRQQTRGFKSRARSSTGLGRNRSQDGSSSTLDELRAKFDSRGSQFAGLRPSAGAASPATSAAASNDKQSFSRVLRQHEQSPDIQSHLKVAFADGYATADGNMTANKQSGLRLVLRRLTKLFWGFIALLIVLQLIVSGFDGVSGMAGGVSGSMNMNQHEVNPEEVNVTFSDVKGVDEAKEELEEIVDFLKDPERFSSLGGRMPRGVLLVGKPGIGKTLLARAVAGEAGVPFFHASGSEFDEIFVGTGAKRVRQLFAAAKAKAPCVLFIDEIDTCGAKRTSSQLHPYANQTINQLLAEMDGFNKSEGVVVLGATNKRENLDPALLRPGRFDVEVQVWPPDLKGRTELFTHYLSKVKADTVEVNAENLAKKTVGFLGAQIANMVNQAAIKAARDNASYITMKDLEWALDKERMGPEKKNKIDDAVALRRTASHEAGHTIVNYFTEHAMPINKVTITPRGHTLGRLDMMQEREYDTTKGSLLASLDVAMGGRVGEQVALGADNVADGASSDFQNATGIASQIVKSWGMSNAAGTRTYGDAKFLSESMKELVDVEIKKLLDESYARAETILIKRKAEHQRLTEALLKYETLDADDVKAVIEGREPPSAAKKYSEKNKGLNVDSKLIIAQGLRVTGGTANLLPVVPASDKPRTPN